MVCFLAAFALPATLRTALLVMAPRGGARIIPIAPVSPALRIAMLSYGLVELTGQAIDPARMTAFTFGVSAILCVVMLAVSLPTVGRELQRRSPRGRGARGASPPAPCRAGSGARSRRCLAAPGRGVTLLVANAYSSSHSTVSPRRGKWM